ncbi:ABC transporter ATP-binding protein [Gottschalkia acidurici 9a]|uniref:ABC transporter ATP-binding protein n=1 Tax=Gottschalkia acidurici (strain ATCC 7906 / DSM 604 / BCRC 14475 / CIP 104303 / KCTC 5404 / NCIMB 10678 / 9a) TaxID=1128398 RepID=K0B184_GOTA9|nr:ABC transporter ATP-binding protein [Gottschalkia acidurici]AFS78832.1 ABC transporter ATP-binding protein [Gottschalkia acidurici 9a]
MKNNIKNLKRLYIYIKPYKIHFIIALLMTLIASIANGVIPLIIGLGITEMSSNVADIVKGVEGATINYKYIGGIIGAFLGIGIITQISQYLSIAFMTNVVQNSMKDLRRDITNKINRLPISYFDSKKQGNILSIVTNDIDAIVNALQQSVIQVVTAILGIIFAVGMMIYISIPMALITMLIIPLSIIVSKTIVKKSQKYFMNQQNALGDLNGYIGEAYNGFNVIKLYGKEEDTIKEFEAINNRLTQNGFKASFVSGLMMPLVGAISYFAYISMAVLGGYYAIIGVLTVGNMQAFIQYIWQVNQPISQITQLSNILQTASAATMRIFSILDEEEEPEEINTLELPNKVEGYVTFENVCFGYSKDKTLIKNLSFSVKKGEKVAIVGPTGAGKSTLINLLMRFYDVDSGTIKIDGIDTKNMKRSDVRSIFGMVLQDAWLYSASIKENIKFGKLDATEDEVVNAAKIANVDHFIRTLPNGYNMELNEDTSNISLGQKQLLTIARAVISDPKILILDEATSSVDTRLELLIQKAMNSIMKGRTSFIIAHRLSTIRDADIILVMDKGSIIEHGNHDELIAKKGFYEKLYNSQFANS